MTRDPKDGVVIEIGFRLLVDREKRVWVLHWYNSELGYYIDLAIIIWVSMVNFFLNNMYLKITSIIIICDLYVIKYIFPYKKEVINLLICMEIQLYLKLLGLLIF